MTIVIILIAAAVVIGYLMLASITARFQYETDEKSAVLSYSLLSFNFNIVQKQGRLFLFRIPVYTFTPGKKKKKKEPKVDKTVKEKPEKKEKKKKRFKLSDLKIEYLRMAKSLIGGIRIRELLIKISGGYREPFYTGKMYAYYWAAKGMYPNLMSHFHFSPDFSSERLNIEGKGLVSIKMFYIFRLFFGLLADKTKEKLNNLFVIRKKGASYG
jgi:hypothetical protein